MITLVTDIKCDDLDQYASLRGLLSDLPMYGYDLHMSGTRVQLIWIDVSSIEDVGLPNVYLLHQ